MSRALDSNGTYDTSYSLLYIKYAKEAQFLSRVAMIKKDRDNISVMIILMNYTDKKLLVLESIRS